MTTLKILNFTKFELPLEIASDTALIDALNRVLTLWKAGKIPLQNNAKSFSPADVVQLLSPIELLRLQLVHGDISVSKASRLSILLLPDDIRAELVAALMVYYPQIDQRLAGYFWYRPGGFMSWHTNSNDAGIRLYISYAEVGDRSFFRYQDPATHNVETSNDTAGWQLRFFEVSVESDKKFWHCVQSDTDRLSLGFRLAPPA